MIYFELNNWFAGRDYPNAQPFRTWMTDRNLNRYFLNEEWVKENKLIVVATNVDMSLNLCITATEEWVKNNCPKLLSDEKIDTKYVLQSEDGVKEVIETYAYKSFLRYPDENEKITGRFGCPFLEFSEENIGIHWYTDFWDDEFHDYYIEEKDNENQS